MSKTLKTAVEMHVQLLITADYCMRNAVTNDTQNPMSIVQALFRTYENMLGFFEAYPEESKQSIFIQHWRESLSQIYEQVIKKVIEIDPTLKNIELHKRDFDPALLAYAEGPNSLPSMLQFLFDKRAAFLPADVVEEWDIQKAKTLTYAIARGNNQIVRMLLEAGVKPNIIGNEKTLEIFGASLSVNADELVFAGKSSREKQEALNNTLFIAVHQRDYHIIHLALKAGADPLAQCWLGSVSSLGLAEHIGNGIATHLMQEHLRKNGIDDMNAASAYAKNGIEKYYDIFAATLANSCSSSGAFKPILAKDLSERFEKGQLIKVEIRKFLGAVPDNYAK